jgi:hypothetical protein
MNVEGDNNPLRMSSGQIIKLIVGIIVFGVLMGIRTELQQVWMRAFVAACAGGVLGWVVLQAKKTKA